MAITVGHTQAGDPIFLKPKGARVSKRCFHCGQVIAPKTPYKYIGNLVIYRKSYYAEEILFHKDCSVNVKGVLDFWDNGWSYFKRANDYYSQKLRKFLTEK
jgi:hypothetical protein